MIKISPTKNKNILSLPEYFANVVDIDKDFVTYELLCEVSDDAQDVAGLKVTANISTVTNTAKIANVAKGVNSFSKKPQTAAFSSQENKEQKVETNSVSILEHKFTITNHPQKAKIKTEYSKKNEQSLSVLPGKNFETKPIEYSGNGNKYLSNKAIFSDSQDPSDVVESTVSVAGEYSSFSGAISAKNNSNGKFSNVQSLAKAHDASVSEQSKYAKKVSNDEVDSVVASISNEKNKYQKTIVYVSRSLLDEDTSLVVFSFEALDKNGVAIAAAEAGHDVRQAVNYFTTPKTAPVVNHVLINSRARFSVTNLEKYVSSVGVYKRVIGTYGGGSDSYEFVGNYDAEFGTCTAEIIHTHENPTIYRFVPISEFGQKSGEFAGVVVTANKRQFASSAVSFSHSITKSGVEINIVDIPIDCVSYSLMRKNLTLSETNFSKVSESKYVKIENTRTFPKIVDASIKENHLYEYCLSIVYSNGIERKLGSEFVEYIAEEDSKVNVSVQNLTKIQTDKETANLQFDIVSSVPDKDADTLKNLLQTNGYTSEFSKNIESEKEKLKELLSHTVTRTDVYTGEKVDFGIVNGTKFDDSVYSKKVGAPPLERGKRYVYTVVPLVRKADTLFDDNRREMIGKRTGKKYITAPAKLFHPKKMRTGAIVTAQSERFNDARSKFEYGRVGSYTRVEVTFEDQESTITNAKVNRFDVDSIQVSWTLSGTSRKNPVDHFLVYRILRGIKELVGKTCVIDKDELNYQYLHELTENDIGTLEYAVSMVYFDMSVSKEMFLGRVIVLKDE